MKKTIYTRMKRFIAWVLVLCIISGTLPAFAMETPEEKLENFKTVSLDFRAEYQRADGKTPLDATVSENGWQVNRERTAGSLLNGGTEFAYKPHGLSAAVNDAIYVKHGELSLDFEIPADGFYSIELNGAQYPQTGVLAVVFIDDMYVGKYDFGAGLSADAENKDIGETVNLSEVSLSEGIHTVSFRRISGGDKPNNIYIMPGCMTFKRIDEMRGQANINFVKMWDDAYAANGYTGSPSPAANTDTIDDLGWQINTEHTRPDLLDGLYSDFSYGNRGLYVQIGDMGYPKYGEIAFDFTVDSDGLYSVKMGGSAGEKGIAAVFVDSQYLGTYDFGKVEGSVFAEAVNVGNVNLTAGKHTVALQRVGGDATFRLSYINFNCISDIKAERTVDFRRLWSDTYYANIGKADADKLAFPSPLNAQLSTHGWEIDRAKSAPATFTDYVPTSSNYGLCVRIADANVAFYADFAVKFTVDKTAEYRLAFNGSKHLDGTICDIYLDDVKVGEYSFRATNAYTMIGEDVDLGVHELDHTKEHTLTLRRIYESSGNWRLYPGSFRLMEIGEDESAPLTLSSAGVKTIALGGHKSCNITAQVAGETVSLEDAQFEIKSANEEIATAEISKSDDGNAILTVTGNGLGDTNINIIAVANGRIGSIDIPVSVAPADEFRGVVITVDKNELEVGDTAKVSARAETMSDTEIPLDENTLYFKSSDPKVAAVDAAGNILAKSKGEAEITAYATVGGILHTASVKVAVTDSAPLVSAEMKNPGAISIGDKIQLEVLGKLESGNAADMSDATVTYSLVECSPQGAATLSSDGVLNALQAGYVKVKADVSLNGVDKTTPELNLVISEVSGDGVVLNFAANQQANPIDKTLADEGWQVNKGLSSYNTVTYPQYFAWQSYGFSARIWGVDDSVTADLSIDFNVPKAGAYNLEVGYYQGAAGGLSQVYVNGVYAGNIDFYSVDSSSKSIRLNSFNLKAGVNNITFRRTNWESGDLHYKVIESEGNYNHFTIASISFTPILSLPEIASVQATSDDDIYSAGENGQVNTVVTMTDGNEYSFGKLMSKVQDDKNKLVFENLTTDILTVNADGSFRAKSAGEGKIRVTAYVNGKAATEPGICTVKVDAQSISAVNVKIKDEPLVIDEKRELDINAALADGRAIDVSDLDISVISQNTAVVEVIFENGKYYLKGKQPGISQITLTAKLDGKSATAIFDAQAHGEAFNTVEIATETPFMRLTDNGTQLEITAKTYVGTVIDIPEGAVWYESSNADCAKVDENGFVTPVALGSAVITAHVKIGNIEREGRIEITIREGKTRSTFYTQEKVEALRENVDKYSWARGDKDAVIKEADRLVALGNEYLWNAVTTQQLPRSTSVGYRYDPEAALCRYCGVDMQKKYGSAYAWKGDPINTPWKIQCPECRRQFPTNNFEGFYKLGIDENGNWNYEKSHREHYNLFKDEYVSKGVETYEEYENMRSAGQRLPGVGYLKNETATDVATVSTVNGGRGLGPTETAEAWGVDDGYGYRTGEKYIGASSFGAIDEVHTYIAFYNHFWLWYFDAGLITGGLNKLRDAYLLTGNAKYGRAGAIMVDRIADIYPDMYAHRLADEDEPSLKMALSDSTAPYGRIVGCIWETPLMKKVILAYDAFFAMYQDETVKQFLSAKAKKYNFKNTKDTTELLCTNIEDGILREFYKATVDGHSWGNFGTHQSGVAYAAVVLDTQPETNDWLDWIFRISPYSHSETKPNPGNTGGDVNRILVNTVDRDGMGDESSPQYTNLWVNMLQDIAEPLSGYVTDEKYDIYKHPKVRKMQTVEFDLITVGKATVQIGDSSGCANTGFNFYENYLLDFYKNTKDYRVGQILYFLNGNKTSGMHYDKFTKNPESMQTDIQEVIDTYGEFDFGKSTMLTGYGFSILRGGDYAKAELNGKDVDTQQDAWLYFGNALRHGHLSTLNLGLEAFGLNISPDNGYPESANGDDLMLNSNHASISHNVVLVDDRSQIRISRTGNPLHFNDSGRVKLMDADVPYAYDNTKIYRRSVFMIQATDDVSYYVDFFRVKGGDDHLYSFHALSDTHPEVDKGIEFIKQPMGSYAGPDIPVGTIGHTTGYSYFYDVHRADDPKVNTFYADFKINDFNKTLGGGRNLNLRMTMLNDFELSEISLTKTQPPQVQGNPKELQYVFARRSGEDLDSLFTTVFEPYEGKRYIKNMSKVSIAPVSGNAVSDAEAKAIKVELEGGREDYIIYASDNTREYLVDGKISFRGAFGVYSITNGECVYSYVSDGTELFNRESNEGIKGECSALTGEVVDFTDTLSYKNSITVSVNENIDPQTLAGKYIRINNDNEQNGVYGIKSAYIPDASKPNVMVLDIGDTTLVRKYKNSENFEAGYDFNIKEGQTFDIPLTYVYDSTPVIANISDKTVTAGKKFTMQVNAVSPNGKSLTYFIKNDPRGVSFDGESGTLTWIPDSKQVGVHPIIVGATDGMLSTTNVVKIEVVAAINSGSDSSEEKPSGSGTGTDSGAGSGSAGGGSAGGGASGGGGGGGGAPSGGGSSDTSDDDKTEDKPEDKPEDVVGGDTTEETAKFIDLGNHTWAEDAIYALVEKGVVNGTSANTYAPANNIKRADFAIMLVRAFGVTEGETEHFADVDASKYYAKELNLAKANGIVGGIGDNKFNPEGEITRQDMMLMLARALEAQGKKLDAADESVLAQFADAAQISGYAREAVASVAQAGIIAGSNGCINPLAKATRAEIAVMLNRVLAK